MANADDLRWVWDKVDVSESELGTLFNVAPHCILSWLTSGRMPGWAAEIAKELRVLVKRKQPLPMEQLGILS